MMVVLIICVVVIILIASIVVSPLGLFLAPTGPIQDTTSEPQTIQTVILELEGDYFDRCQDILRESVHDTYSCIRPEFPWRDIISVYIAGSMDAPDAYLDALEGIASERSDDLQAPYELMIMDSANREQLISTFWDMASIREEYKISQANQDSIILILEAEFATIEEMIDYYGFDGSQIGLLYMLLDLDEAYWEQMLYGT